MLQAVGLSQGLLIPCKMPTLIYKSSKNLAKATPSKKGAPNSSAVNHGVQSQSFVHNGRETEEMAKLTYKEVWDKLSKINVNAHAEEKMGLTYLSWAWAYGIMMEHYPDLQIRWHRFADANDVLRDVAYYEGGTASVTCTVAIGDLTKKLQHLRSPSLRRLSRKKTQ